MKKIYKLFFLPIFLFLGIGALNAQCLSPSQFGSTTASSTGTVNATTCAYGGEYSLFTFTSTGNYVFIGTGGAGNFLTITDNSNNVIGFGFSPLAVAIPSTGVYRSHVSVNASCGTDSQCHTLSVGPVNTCTSLSQYGSATVNSATGFTTTVTTCQYGGEFSVVTFTSLGTYTVNGTGPVGNYFTIKNVAGNVVYAQGASPLVFNVPATGVYRFHFSTSGPTACATDANCHTVTIVSPGAPPPPPANDNCSTPQSITTSGTFTGTTLLATTETVVVPTCITSAPTQPGVWYTLTGNGNKLGVDLCSTSWDSKVWVFTGTCGNFTCVAGNDDFGPLCASSAASATWCSTNGTPYLILVAGYSSASNFTLTTTQTVVTQPTVAINSASLTICSGNSTTLTASGAESYTWNPGASTATSIVASPSASIVYTLSGTNACSSASSNSVQIIVNPTPTLIVNSGTVCTGDSFTINPSGASTYTIQGGNAIVTPTANSTYSVVGTSTAGCNSLPVTSSVVVNPLPVIAVNSGTICEGNTFTITPSGASTYTIQGGNALVSPTVNATYSVVGTSSLGCNSAPVTSTVDVNAAPVIVVNSGNICIGQSFTINPSGAATFTIEGGNAVVTPTTSTNYTVAGTSSLGCISLQNATSSVTVNPNPTVSVNSGAICSGNSFTIVPNGASTYTIQGGNAVVSPTANSSYTVIGTSAAGCLGSNMATSNVTVNASPSVAISGSTLVCAGQVATLTASGATSYTWNTASNTSSILVSPSTNTVYSVTGTSSLTGCSNTASFSIVVSNCTGIDNQSLISGKVLIYPNPNNGEFFIQLNNGMEKQITVYDVNGKLIATQTTTENVSKMNLNSFDNGVYFIRVQSEGGSEMFRVIKQ